MIFAFLGLIKKSFTIQRQKLLIYFYFLNFIFIWITNYPGIIYWNGFFLYCFIMQTVSFIKVPFMQRYVNGSVFFYFCNSILCPNKHFLKIFQSLDQDLYITKSSGQFPWCPCLTYQKHVTQLVTACLRFQDTALSQFPHSH